MKSILTVERPATIIKIKNKFISTKPKYKLKGQNQAEQNWELVRDNLRHTHSMKMPT